MLVSEETGSRFCSKMGSDKHETDANFIKPTDLELYFKKCIRDKWEQECLTINTHLNTIKNNVRRWNPPLKLNRKDRIKIQRLRIGHTNITHKHLLTGDNPPICDTCNIPLDVEHILNLCSKYTHTRQLFNISNNTRLELNEPEKIVNILNYLKTTDIYQEI
ncbi:hypothetical protein JTB14_014700 [Gonioctena quinquepunctata]|nr:hypothetical protein JTB14_014700 [Gonioctena quinquepunctata]